MVVKVSCHKTKYAKEEFALAHIDKIKKKSKRDVVPIRAYLCLDCGLWHLTSTFEKKDIIINKLKAEVASLKEEVERLKKGMGKEIYKDEMVKKLQNVIVEKDKTISKVRMSNKELINQLTQLRK
jgi:predicted RNase H-like nuclease (RuvC/YqgF family)